MTRTRFAPSPTGHLHIGGLRTALYCYLLAKQEEGQFILRIEDTDKTREVEGAKQALIDTLEGLGITPDESIVHGGDHGPYIQSERLDIYNKYIQQLIDAGHAYHCFCSPERLEKMREKQIEAGLTPKYDGTCRDLTPDEVQAKLDAGEEYVIRLKVPKGEKVSFVDRVKGKIEFPTNDIDDQILMKRDGYPTYHFAAIVDDHLMEVTHIIRGDEWVASTGKHVLLYNMFGWEAPEFVHLSVILGKDRKKLSKRNGDVHVSSFLEKGFLKNAILNYIALIGWNPKTTEEFFTLSELVDRFKLDHLNKADGVFDMEKLTWMNAQYIAKMDTEQLYDILSTYLSEHHQYFFEDTFSQADADFNLSILRELQTRLETLADFPELTKFFYTEPNVDTKLLLHEKMKIENKEDAKKFLEFGAQILDEIKGDLGRESLQEIYIPRIAEAGYKNGQVLWPMRVALTGEKFSPGAFEMIEILGLEKSRQRISKILEALS